MCRIPTLETGSNIVCWVRVLGTRTMGSMVTKTVAQSAMATWGIGGMVIVANGALWLSPSVLLLSVSRCVGVWVSSRYNRVANVVLKLTFLAPIATWLMGNLVDWFSRVS